MAGHKSIGMAYLFWFLGGIFGWHHFYLGRDMQGFLWWCTGGGYIVGWLRDLFLIPQYIKAANYDPDYMKRLSETMRYYKSPPFSTLRFSGMICVGYFFGSIIHSAIPRDEFAGINWQFLYILVPYGCALGVWSVGNIGHEEGTIVWPLLAAYGLYPFYKSYPGELSFTAMLIASAYAFDWFSKKWRRQEKPKKPLYKRTSVLLVAAFIYLGLWGSSLYFNGTVTDPDGEEIPIHEVLHHFFTSPWWRDLGQSLWDTITVARNQGWAEVWKMAIELLDPHGEQNAYSVLGLDLGANQTSINSKCRQLSMKWHPDRVKDPDGKRDAQEKFYEIQQACELLSTSKAKRRRQNKKSQV